MFGLFGKIKIEFPLALQVMAARANHSMFTPDIPWLSERQNQLLFVCDQWMSDRRQHFVLDELGCERVAQHAFTRSPLRYLNYDGGFMGDPDTVPLGWNREGYKIKGEIWNIPQPDRNFVKLDKLKLNGVKFERRRVYILVPHYPDMKIIENVCDEEGRTHGHHERIWDGMFPDGHPLAGKKYELGKEHVCILRTWMYTGVREYWEKLVTRTPANFDEVNRYKPKENKRWLSEYYKFQTPKDS